MNIFMWRHNKMHIINTYVTYYFTIKQNMFERPRLKDRQLINISNETYFNISTSKYKLHCLKCDNNFFYKTGLILSTLKFHIWLLGKIKLDNSDHHRSQSVLYSLMFQSLFFVKIIRNSRLLDWNLFLESVLEI